MMPEMKKVFAELRSEHGVKSLGAEGFCWGGHYVVACLGAFFSAILFGSSDWAGLECLQ